MTTTATSLVRLVDWTLIVVILLLLLMARSSCIATAAVLHSTGKSHPVLESTSASGLSEPTSRSSSSTGLDSSLSEIKSFEHSAPLKEELSAGDDTGQNSKVKTSGDLQWVDAVARHNGTETENQTTSPSQFDPWSTQQSHLPRRSGSRSRSVDDFEVKDVAMSKVTPESVFKTEVDFPGLNCCSPGSNDHSTSPPDVDSYDEYDDDDDDDDDNYDDNDNGGGGEEVDETENDEMKTDGSDAYGYGDRSDGDRVDGEGGETGGGGDGEGGDGDFSAGEVGGVDSAKVEYVYVTDDNVTGNESVISSNQDKHEWKNSDRHYYYSQGAIDAEWRASGLLVNGQSLREGLIDHDPGSRDYVLGVRQRGFSLHLGLKSSGEMRRSYQRRSSLNLRWLEHRPVNQFAIFLWLAAALAFVGVAITAFRFRHSVISAIQSTRANYKNGRRIGVEEANGLLSHAQV